MLKSRKFAVLVHLSALQTTANWKKEPIISLPKANQICREMKASNTEWET